MFGSSSRSRALAVVAIAATSLLGACISIPAPAPGGGTTPAPAPALGGDKPPAPEAPGSIATSCHDLRGDNGGVGFWDIGLAQCWACPEGSNRTIFSVEHVTACQYGLFGAFVAAERLN